VFEPIFIWQAHEHLPIRALSKEDCFISHALAPNTFHLIVAASAEKVETHAVLLGLDQFAQSVPEFSVLGFCQVALEQTELHPLPIGLENLMNLSATLILWNVIGDNHMHG
jgi:hypothetical protein